MRNRSRFSGRSGRKGTGFVEAALVMSLVAFTLIGLVDIGSILVIHQGLTERVRAGARYGVVKPYDAAKISNVVVYNTDTPGQSTSALLNLRPDLVTVNLYNQNTPEARIEVKIVNYPFHLFTPYVHGDYVGRPIVCSMPLEDQGGGVS